MRNNQAITRGLILGALLSGSWALASCSGGGNPDGSNACKTKVTGFSSPTAGFVTMTGQFFADETVKLVNEKTGVLAAFGTPATDRTSFTLSMPSGTQDYDLIISCNGKTDDHGVTTIAVK